MPQYTSLVIILASLLVIVPYGGQQSFSQLYEQDINASSYPSAFLTYNDARHGITMQYPSDWTQEEGTESQEGLIVHNFFSPEEADRSYAIFKIVIEEPSPSSSIAEYLSLTIDTYSQEEPHFPDFQVISSYTEDVTFAGRSGYLLEATYTDSASGRQQDMREVGTIDESNNRAVYVQTIVDSDSEASKYWPIIEEMINSLQFTNGFTDGSSGFSDAVPTQEEDFNNAPVSGVTTTLQPEHNSSNIETPSLMNNANPPAAIAGDDATFQDEEQMQEGGSFRLEYGGTVHLIEAVQYENAELGLELLYPSTWTKLEYTDGGEGFTILADITSPEEQDGSYVAATIQIEDLSLLAGDSAVYAGMSLDAYLRASEEAFANGDPPYQILSSDPDGCILLQRPAYCLMMTYNDSEGGPQDVLEVATVVENLAYNFRFVLDSHSEASKYWPIIEEMINSLQFTDGGSGFSDAVPTQEEDFSSDSFGPSEVEQSIDAVRYSSNNE